MSTPATIACVIVGVLLGFAIDYVSGRKRAKERAELATKADKSEAELQAVRERIVFTGEPRVLSDQAIRDLLDWEDKQGASFGVENPNKEAV